MSNLSDSVYKGAMADDARLAHTREVLARLKETKVLKTADKWRGGNITIYSMLKYLAGEVTELSRAVESGKIGDTLDECVDVSNCVDIIATLAIQVERSVYKA